jgi:GNT-I family
MRRSGDAGVTRFAPIAVFAYRRPDHLRRALQTLAACPEFADSEIHVFVDGPRGAEDFEAVTETRALARAVLASRAAYRFSETNRGLAPSVIGGVTELVERYGRVVVVEDDLEVAPDFLAYMNAALDRYADDEPVMQVSGHMYDVPALAGRSDAVMLPFTTTWGWATWARAWRHFDAAAIGWEVLARDAELRRAFNLDGTYDYASMLEKQMAGRSSSWGIRWYWSVFRRAGLVVYPPVTRVRNTGFDGSGTHRRGALRRFGTAVPSALQPVVFPAVGGDAACLVEVKRAIWRQNGGWLGYGIDRARRLVSSKRP